MFIFVVGFILLFATLTIYAYSSSLGYLNWWQRIIFGVLTALGFIGVFWLSRISEPNYVIAFFYFLAWMIGGTILYSMIMTPLLGIIAGLGYYFKKPTIRITGTWIILAVAFGLSIIGIEQRTWVKIVSYEIPTEKTELLGTTFAVVADSQFNIANNKQFARRITKKLETLNYDVLLLPGDVFDGAELNWEPLETEFKKWSQKTPVFMIPGNHEEYGDYSEFMDIMRRNGITTLEDEMVTWNGISIIGFKYYGRENVEQGTRIIREFFEENNVSQPIVVMNHEPRYAELFAENSADLVIHGHTHGGQFWPLKYVVQRIYGDYWYGKNTVNETTFITSSGLGLAAFPSRLFNTPEIVLINFIEK
jgi:predicted MPP superfamily phosphohydrolase